MALNPGIKLYRVTADYRKHNPNKPHYYVAGRNIHEARQRFKDRISWLDIYDVSEVADEALVADILNNPLKYICF